MSRTKTTDWIRAEILYLSLGPTRTLNGLAAKLKLGERAVGNAAARYGWAEKAVAYDEAVRERLVQRSVRDRVDRVSKILRLADEALDQIEAGLAAQTLELKLSDLPKLATMTELLTGQPTERSGIALEEVEQTLRRFLEVAARFVPKAHRAELLQAVRLELESGGLTDPEAGG